MLRETRRKHLKFLDIAGRDGTVFDCGIEGLAVGQKGDPPRNSRRPVDESHIRAKRFGQFVGQQREVGAGEHDGIDIRAAIPRALRRERRARRCGPRNFASAALTRPVAA